MRRDDFVDASIFLRFLEKQLLSDSVIERMIDAPGTEELLRMLTQNTRVDFSSLKNVSDYDAVLNEDLKGAYDVVRQWAWPDYMFIPELAATPYDAHNLRVALKSFFMGEEPSVAYSALSSLDMGDAGAYIARRHGAMQAPETKKDSSQEYISGPKGPSYAPQWRLSYKPEWYPAHSPGWDPSAVPGWNPETAPGWDPKDVPGWGPAVKSVTPERLPLWAREAVNDAMEAFAKSRDPQDIDIRIDRHMYKRMLELAKKTKSPFIERYVRLSIDYQNVKTLFRIRDMRKGVHFLKQSLIAGGDVAPEYLEGFYDATQETIASKLFYRHFGTSVARGLEAWTRSRNYSELERIFDNALISYLKDGRMTAYGPENLYAFLLFKENEIRQMRVLIAGKMNELSPENLKERLRDNYA